MRTRSSGRARRTRQAFTLIEIMAALGVMTVASMAIIGLQSHTMRANIHARQLATGLQIAQMWIERFKQDAHRWNQASDLDDDPSPEAVLAGTSFLREVVNDQAVFQQIPNALLAGDPRPLMSNGYDYQGLPIDWGDADEAATLHYCVSFRPTWVILGRAIRVDVRVWWARESTNDDPATRSTMAPYVANACTDDDLWLSPGGAGYPNYHFAYLSTVVGVTEVLR
jgi:type IV pilus assembly protein PilV